jgi:phage baseplate assembly protein W
MAEPLGIKVPIQMGLTGYFNPTYTSIEEATANMYNLLLTQKGERPMQPDFGTRIYGLLFEQITRDLKTLVEDEIRTAVADWLPYVELVEVTVDISDENIENNRIDIKVGFGLRRDLKQYNEIIVSFAT